MKRDARARTRREQAGPEPRAVAGSHPAPEAPLRELSRREEPALADEVDVIGPQHQVGFAVLGVDGPDRVGEDQDAGPERVQDTDAERDLIHGVALVAVAAPRQHRHRHAVPASEGQPPWVAGHGRGGPVRELGGPADGGVRHLARNVREPGAEDDAGARHEP